MPVAFADLTLYTLMQVQMMTATHPHQALRNVITSVPVVGLVQSIIIVGVVVAGPA